ncbi:hypothetical protein [Bifidobacterium scaligerum]|uniref:hypothetical protein n=1 Tax=Bifidobacterium scaligerum TaxID=2052656 RepID=UPI0010560934|nr:hypothetical protein [Bifidobacterium scaligerum]
MRKALWLQLPFAERIAYILRAVCHQHPDWTVCGISAAAAHGYTATYYQHRFVHIAVSDRSKARRHGPFVGHYIPKYRSVVVNNGIRATTPIRTMFDCARTLDFSTAMSICTMGLRATQLTAEALQNYCQINSRKHGIRRAIYVAQNVDPLCTNGGEAVAYATILELGFAAPECQRMFINPIDNKPIYADFTWTLSDGSLIIGELDGREKYINPAMTKGMDSIDIVLHEKDREAGINLLHIPVARFQMQHVHNRAQLEQRLSAANVPRPGKGKRTPFTGFECRAY